MNGSRTWEPETLAARAWSREDAAQPVVLTLPWPPTVNHYWRRVGAKTLISERGRQYREAVAQAVMLAGHPRVNGALRVRIEAWPPDRRRRDIDNLLKSVLDALEHAGVYEDDGDIDDLRIVRRDMSPGGAVRVTVEEGVKDESA